MFRRFAHMGLHFTEGRLDRLRSGEYGEDNAASRCTKNLDLDIAVMETAQYRLRDDASSPLNRA
jgi:hypothetical protein